MTEAKGKIILISGYVGRKPGKAGLGLIIEGRKNTYEFKEKFKEAGFRWTGEEWRKEFKIREEMPETEEENIKAAKEAIAKADEIINEIDFCEFEESDKIKALRQNL